MVVGVLQLKMIFHDARSLKDKRGRLRKVLGRIKNQFEVAAAEIGDQNLWQRAEIGVAVIGSDRALVNQVLDRVLNFADSLGIAEIIDHKIELLNL